MKIINYQERVPVPTGAGRMPSLNKQDVAIADPGETLTSLAGAGLRVAAAVDKHEEEQARAWTSTTLSGARLRWTEEFVRRQSEVEPGAAGFTPKILEDYDKWTDDAVAKAPSASSQRFLQERLSDLRSDLGTKALTFEAQARVDWRADQFTASADNISKLMNTDTGQYQVALAELLATIDSSAMPPVKKSEVRQRTIDRVSGAAVTAQMQKSPVAFLQSIGFYGAEKGPDGTIRTRPSMGDLKGISGNLAFDALPFEKRVQLFDQAIRLKAQIDVDMNSAAVTERKRLADAASKDLWDKHFSGTLRLADIQAMKPVLDDNEYKSLREAFSKGPNPIVRNDPGTLRELTRLMYTDASAAYGFAFKTHQSGLLTDDTFRVESARAQELIKGGGPKNQYERDRSWINRTLNPGELVQDPVGRQRVGDALQTFDDWYLAGQGKRTDKETRERATEIIDQYRFFSLSETVMALPMPRGTRIRRTTDPSHLNEDIGAAGLKLQQDRDSGKLRQNEYENEITTLNRWRRAMEQGRQK